MIDNQLAAQLLFSHQLASQEQILEVWPQVTAEKDVGMLLVEKGILPRQTYRELVSYLETLPASPAAPEPEASAEPAVSPGPEVVEAPPAAARIPVPDPSELRIESSAGPGLPATIPAERDPSIVDAGRESWTAVREAPAIVPLPRPEKHSAPEALEVQELPLAPRAESDRPPAAPAPHRTEAEIPPARLSRADRRASEGPKIAVPETIGAHSTWDELLAFARARDAADLHLSAGNPILLRRYGALQPAGPEPMEQASVRAWVEQALDPERFRDFEAKGDLEFIYTLPHYGRYRVTLLKQRRGWDATARVIPDRIRGMEEAGLPESCRELTKWAQGLVLVTGPVGCGKSSTLATLVDIVNRERHDHIITIEEPIEILYPPAQCRITQRQIGPHTLSRDAALRAALREDPDIIVISELRDLDTIRLAVSAAETGHLVFGTMNTTNAARTLSRLVDSFPPEEQGIVRNMISESLRGVISQQLLPRKDGTGVLPAYEVLLVTTAVANMIRKDEIHQLGTAMLTGKSNGMVVLDDSLRFLVDRGLVDASEAMARAANPKDFEKYLGRR